MLPRRWPLCGSGMRDLHCKAMPFRPADNSPFRRHYAPMGATRRSLLCLCMCDGFSIAHRRENARIIAEAPPVAEKARRFRGSVPVFTPQRGWKPADTTVFRIAEAPPVAYFSQQFFLFVSDGILFVNSDKKYAKNAGRNRWFLDFLSSQELRSLWAKGDRLCNKPAAAPSQVKGRVGLPLGEYGSPRPVCGLVVGMTGGGKAGKGRSPRWGERPFVWKNIRV